MGILDQLFAKREARTVTMAEVRRLSLTNYQQWEELGLARATASGVPVTPDNAMKYSAVFACVRVLSETLASLPLHVYERLPRGKKRAQDFYLYSILHDAPNPLQTSFEFRMDLMGHLCLWGNAYCQIEYDGAGRVMELWPLRPDMMLEVKREAGQLMYFYQLPSGDTQWIMGDKVWHLRTLGSNGLTGLSPISLHRQGIGLGLATEEYGARFFGNDARPGGVLEHPGILGDEAYKRITESWEEAHQGLSQSHRIALLEEGMKYQQVGIPPEDAQFLETRMFQIRDVARIYRVSPHLIGDLERATFSNIEHLGIEFISYTMLPWLTNWEQSIKQRLMLARERPRYFAEFLTAALERGDIKTRYEAYSQGRQNGWLSANDIRELENMNPVEGGDVYLVPLNMVAVGEPPPEQPQREQSPAESRSLEQRQRDTAIKRLALAGEYFPLFRDILGRTVRREVADIRRQARKMLPKGELADFLLWLERFYEEHRGFIGDALAPAYSVYTAAVIRATQAEVGNDGDVKTEKFVAEYNNLYTVRYTEKQRQEMVRVIDRTVEDEAELLPAVEKRLDHWDEVRPEQEANRELRRAGNAIALVAYGALGVIRKRWATVGDTCPYCKQLNGATVEVSGLFLPRGATLESEGGAPMVMSIDIGHPPAHDGCDCQVVAG